MRSYAEVQTRMPGNSPDVVICSHRKPTLNTPRFRLPRFGQKGSRACDCTNISDEELAERIAAAKAERMKGRGDLR